MEKSTMERDYELIKGAVIFSLLPSPIKVFIYFGFITLSIFFLRMTLSNSCPRTLSIYPPDYFQDSLIRPFFIVGWNLWHLFCDIVLYAYFGACF